MNFKLLLVALITIAASPSMGQVPEVGSSSGTIGAPFQKDELKNGDGKQPTSLLTRTGQPVSLASRVNQLEAEFREKIEEINTKTSRTSKDQDEKIAIIRVRERNLAQLLNTTREEMEVLKTTNRDQSKRISQLEQKVEMLQNTSTSQALTRTTKDKLKNGASNGVYSRLSKASTPPSSCQELSMLDYYLDGLYLVKNKQTKKIQTVFCQFLDDNQVLQDMVGNVNVRTKDVHFYVQRNSGASSSVATIPFHLARLNEGDAFSLNSGIFTVPVPGIYHFQFSAVKDSSATYLKIYLRVNDTTVGAAWTEQTSWESKNVVSLSASLRLKVGDKVSLFNEGSGAIFDDDRHYTHFSGWLVEQNYGDEQQSSFQQQVQQLHQQLGGVLGMRGLNQQGRDIIGILGR